VTCGVGAAVGFLTGVGAGVAPGDELDGLIVDVSGVGGDDGASDGIGITGSVSLVEGEAVGAKDGAIDGGNSSQRQTGASKIEQAPEIVSKTPLHSRNCPVLF